jgi:hypothetical protein
MQRLILPNSLNENQLNCKNKLVHVTHQTFVLMKTNLALVFV